MTIVRWILLTAAAVAFLLLAVANWRPVEFHMPDGTITFIRLPLLLAIAFALGWLPTWLMHITARGSWSRRLAKAENGHGAPKAAYAETLPPQAQPTCVPPAGA